MGKIFNVIVSHPGQQHSFKTAGALKKSDMLFVYFTTVYKKKKSLTSFLSFFLKGEDSIRANNRECIELADNEVKQEYESLGLLVILIARIFKDQKIYEKWNNWLVDKFGSKVAVFVKKNKVDAVISYDNNSGTLFKNLEKTNIIRILDVSAANRLYMQKIYNEDAKMCGDFASLYGETQLIRNKKLLKRYKDEIKYADYFLVGSQFVRKSLNFSGVKDEQIKIVPYGVDAHQFQFNLKKHTKNSDIKFLFVGNVSEIKGIYYLLEAFKQIDSPYVKLDIVGKYSGSEELIKPYLPFCNFIGCVPKNTMPEIYKNADILVFPSLGEGFGLVTLEAMACGLPVIVSKNVGSSDVVTEGKNGFVIDIQSVEDIVNKVLWFTKNKSKIEQMSIAARETALKFSWESYENNLNDAVVEIIKERNSVEKKL